MKEFFRGLMDIPTAIGLYCQAFYHGSHALKTYSMVHRLRADKELYQLLQDKENLTQEQKQELDKIVKEYKKTLRKTNVDTKQTS